MPGHYLKPLFEPQSVVLVGASARPEKVGGRILENLIGAGFHGTLMAVNPRYSDLRGVPCFPTVEALPSVPQLAVVATPPPTVPGVIEALGARGVRAAVVITAGFSETGPEGAALERQLLDAARRHGMRIMGPNCVGLMRPPAGLNATFARGHALPGSLALVSQSGAVCTAMLDWATAKGIGFSSVISLGGSTDLDFGEVIDYLSTDEKTQQILMYIEGVRDGRRLVSSLRAAARVKPIIVMKVGRHPAGSRAAVSHTGAIVGRDDVFDAVVNRTGIVRVRTAGELIAAAEALASRVRPSGDCLAVITNGGGPGVMAADRAAELGLSLATLAPETIDKLQKALPANWSHGNPVDLIGDAGPERYRAAITACIEDPKVDGVVAILTPQAMTDADAVADAVIGVAAGQRKPVIAAFMGDVSVRNARKRIREAGLPSYRLPEPAVEAFAFIAQFYRNQRALLEAPGPLEHTEPPDLEGARALVRRVLGENREVLTPTESKEFLAAFHVPVAKSVVAPTVEDAVRVAGELGYPVVMKIHSPDITHKSDVGGVELALADGDAVRAAFENMMKTVGARQPKARLEGVSIERMAGGPHGRELMIGITTDPVFGPTITFGSGGIAVEVLKDRTVALPPLNATLVRDMIAGTRMSKMLQEFRHLPAVDRRALEAVLLRASEIASEIPQVVELDINPLIADERGVLALDARVVVRAVPETRSRYGHMAIHPYPSELVSKVTFDGGRELTLRPIRPEDAKIEVEFVEGLSIESRRLRFQSALRTLTPAMLARFTQIDYDREMALVAIDESGPAERQVGVARYFTMPDGVSCEWAIVVADAWQGKGLGRHMMERLIEVARSRGLERMEGWVLANNESMLELCADLGFHAERDGDALVKHMVLDMARGAWEARIPARGEPAAAPAEPTVPAPRA